MSVVVLQSSRPVSVKIVTVCKFKMYKMKSSLGWYHLAWQVAYRTIFKSKQPLVCTAKFSSRRFDWLREMLPFEPGVLIFSTERISHHAPQENTKIKIPLHKKSRKKTKAKIRQMQCREQNIYGTGKLRTCPNKSPLKWHGSKSHAALKSMAGDVKHCISNIRIVRIQRVANTHKNNRKPYAE